MPNKFRIIAGPCVVESEEILLITAEHLVKVCKNYDVELIFKSSFKKANRTSKDSFTGIGDIQALQLMRNIREKFELRVLTDIHTPADAYMAADYVDILQIPAFLCRQTDLIKSAAETGKVINIKKGQFMAPEDMHHSAEKTGISDKSKVWLTERGTTFGYHNLVVDFRSLSVMKDSGYTVIFDATHSVQMPSQGKQSGGRPEFIPALARAAAAVGIDGLFFETHPDPKSAKSDAATQLPLDQSEGLINIVTKINNLIK